jgi:hypothetical protein
MSLTIGIPEKRGQKYLYVYIKNVFFKKQSNYFVTCKFESGQTGESNGGRTLRTEVQKNTKRPDFKAKNFSFKLPYTGSPSRAPTEPFPNSPTKNNNATNSPVISNHASKGIVFDSESILSATISFQAFEVIQEKDGGSAVLIGTAKYTVGKLLNALLAGEKLQAEVNLEKPLERSSMTLEQAGVTNDGCVHTQTTVPTSSCTTYLPTPYHTHSHTHTL